jgi:hypothetical protein
MITKGRVIRDYWYDVKQENDKNETSCLILFEQYLILCGF